MILLLFEIRILIQDGILHEHLDGVLREHASKFVDIYRIYFRVTFKVVNGLYGQSVEIDRVGCIFGHLDFFLRFDYSFGNFAGGGIFNNFRILLYRSRSLYYGDLCRFYCGDGLFDHFVSFLLCHKIS